MLDALRHLLTHTSPWVGVLLLLLCLAIGLWLGLFLMRQVVVRRVARSRRLGAEGEARAERILTDSGCKIVERQATRTGTVLVDERERPFRVRADALVAYRGQRFVAEYKGGVESAQISHRPTRRQLLEYAWVFDVDGLLLVDADAGVIHAIEFPGL